MHPSVEEEMMVLWELMMQGALMVVRTPCRRSAKWAQRAFCNHQKVGVHVGLNAMLRHIIKSSRRYARRCHAYQGPKGKA